MSTIARAMSAREFMALPADTDGPRWELVNGEMRVSPSLSPGHSWTMGALWRLLSAHIMANGLGMMISDTDVPFGAMDVRRPDLLFYSTARLHLVDFDRLSGPPDLCIKVLSPSNAKEDLEEKSNLYLRFGVEYYWIVDPSAQTIEALAARDGVWEQVATGRSDQSVRLPPFENYEIRLSQLWFPQVQRP